MAEVSLPSQSQLAPPLTQRPGWKTTLRVLRYSAVRLVTLFATVIVGVYLTILIANMGGYVDEIKKAQIREGISLAVSMDPANRALTPAQRNELIEGLVQVEVKRLGLDQPFLLRSFASLTDALTLNLGRTNYLTSDSGSKLVRMVILERLPPTLVLFATANLFLFFFSIFVALRLSRNYGNVADRLVIALAPTSAAPGWFYGIFLILIFSAFLGWLPFGGMVDTPPPADRLRYAWSVLRHMILPVSAITLSAIFLTIYNWRTFFLIYSSEDYVDMAKAKGLPGRIIERRYILRPTLPTIITNFALLVIGLWTGAIILETVFNWPGLGRLLYQAIGLFDTPIIVGSTVIYAYLLAITVFILDFVYALVDPRVRVGEGGGR